MSTVDDSLMTAPFSPTGRVFSIVATPYAMRLDARTAQFDNPPCAHVTSNFPFAFGPNLHWRLDEIPRFQNPAIVRGAFRCSLRPRPCFFRETHHGQKAFNNEDEAAYHYSLPENRLELWAYLESERFIHPVMREFYKERNVVIEERRLRTDSNPIGRLLEQFVTAAFQAHPYHRPTIGWMADLNSFSASDAQKFFDTYYIPSNMVVAVAGDVKPAKALPLLEKYFGRLPTHLQPDETATDEPP